MIAGGVALGVTGGVALSATGLGVPGFGGAGLGGVGLGGVGAGGARPAWAAAQPRGVTLEITELPNRLVAGARPETLTVVVSKRGGGCQKVRWSMLLEVDGFDLDQVRVDRVEEDGSFPVDVVTEGSVARYTDERLDPGTLCRDRTVTARYRINVTGDVDSGRLSVINEAYDTDLRLLARAGATREVVPNPDRARDDQEAVETPPADAAGAAGADDSGATGAADAAGANVDETASDAAADAAAGIPLAWFLIGALMVFFGLSLLLNVRFRQRAREELAQEPPLDDRLSNYRTVPRRPRPGVRPQARPYARQDW